MKKLLLFSLLLLLNCGGDNSSSSPSDPPPVPAACYGSTRFVGPCGWDYDPLAACNDPLWPHFICVACRNTLYGYWVYTVCP
jgi:hypothetical protein